jgi:uncharacterized protein with HEPN domain
VGHDLLRAIFIKMKNCTQLLMKPSQSDHDQHPDPAVDAASIASPGTHPESTIMNQAATALFNAATLANMDEAGSAVLILTEGLEKDEFLHSRITRKKVTELVQILSDCFAQLPATLHEAMPELAWDSWRATAHQLQQPGEACDEALWFAILSLVPATIIWLRTYRHNQPELFSFST